MSTATPRWNLNSDQWEAARVTDGNVVIRAGAGTGKTWSLVGHYLENLLYAVGPSGETPSPSSIVAITYTNAAADELKARIEKTLAEVRPELAAAIGDGWISTIHSFCARVLRAEAGALTGELATDPLFSLLDGEQAAGIQREAIADAIAEIFATDQPGLECLLSVVSRYSLPLKLAGALKACAKYGLSPSQLSIEPATHDLPWSERYNRATQVFITVAEAASRHYSAAKRARGALDFDDAIIRVNRLFDIPEVADRYRSRFTRILIDEFQDTNQLQFDIFRKIARNNLSLVGDKNQSIYSFQGAESSVFQSATEVLCSGVGSGGGAETTLRVNYRSDGGILTFVNEVFSRDSLFGADGLVALEAPAGHDREGAIPDGAIGQRLRILPVSKFKADDYPGIKTHDVEAEWISQEFEQLHSEAGVSYDDMVVVLRARTHADAFVKAFNRRGVAAWVVGGKGLLADPAVSEAQAVLQVVDNPGNENALIAALISVFGNVPDQDLVSVAELARTFVSSEAAQDRGSESRRERLERSRYATMWRACLELVQSEDACSPELRRFVAALQHAQSQVGVIPIDAILKTLIRDQHVERRLTAPLASGRRNYAGEQSYANLCAYAELAAEWESAGGSIREFVADVNERIRAGETMNMAPLLDGGAAAQAEPAVRILSVHETKGLEFPVVAYAIGGTSISSAGGPIRFRVSHEAGTLPEKVHLGMRMVLGAEEIDAYPALTATAKAYEGVEGVTKSGTGEYRYENRDYTLADQQTIKNEMDEALRLYYVGMTRPKDVLLISYQVGQTPNPDKQPFLRLSSAVEATILTDVGQDGGVVAPEWESLVKVASSQEVLNQLAPAGEKPDAPAAKPLGDHAMEAGTAKRQPAGDQFQPATSPRAGDSVDGGRRVARTLQVSPTHIGTIEACPRQYHLRYEMGLGTLRDRSTNSPTARGNAVHALMEHSWHLQEVDPGTAERLLGSQGIERNQWPTLVEQANRLLKTESLAAVRSAETARAEAQHYVRISSDSQEVFLYGILDVLAHSASGGALVIDYKSGKGSPDPNRYLTQARCYALVALRRGAAEVSVRFLFPEAPAAEGYAGTDSGIPFHEYRFTPDDAHAIEQWVGAQAAATATAQLVTDDELERTVARETCKGCGYAGPLCSVGERRRKIQAS